MSQEIEVKIFKPAKSAMQSGKAKNFWILKPVSSQSHRRFFELMGWVSSDSTFHSQLEFEFKTKEEAVEFAKQKGFEYEVFEPKKSSFKVKSYAANFTG